MSKWAQPHEKCNIELTLQQKLMSIYQQIINCVLNFGILQVSLKDEILQKQ